jgi:restriction system protein
LPATLLIYPTLRAVEDLGGSAQVREIRAKVLDDLQATEVQLLITYPGTEKQILIDRMDWARSYAKLGGALDSPRRGLFLLSSFGKDLVDLPEAQAREQITEMDRRVAPRATRPRRKRQEGRGLTTRSRSVSGDRCCSTGFIN